MMLGQVISYEFPGAIYIYQTSQISCEVLASRVAQFQQQQESENIKVLMIQARSSTPGSWRPPLGQNTCVAVEST